MPTNQFLKLSEIKRNTIINASISEFAQNGFINASTNRIVTECGISKGSLFKYFEGKEDLYFYVLDTVISEMMQDMESWVANLSAELFQRLIDYSVLEISWYIRNPIKGRLVIGAVSESDTKIRNKVTQQYGHKGEDFYYRLLEGSECGYEINRNRIADILKWVLEGFNREFLKEVDIAHGSFEQLKEEYVQKLIGYIEILKSGLA